MPPQISNQRKNELNQKYKTERCRHFETHGNCLLNQKCHFAHGDAELRKPEDPLTVEQMNLAMKSIQWQNCNQNGSANRGRGGRGGQGRGAPFNKSHTMRDKDREHIMNKYGGMMRDSRRHNNNPRGGYQNGQQNTRGGFKQNQGGMTPNQPGGM